MRLCGSRFRIPVTNVVTQAAEIDRTISQEVTFAKLWHGVRGSRTPDRVRGAVRNDVIQRHAANRGDWNPYGSGRGGRRGGVDGAAPPFWYWRRWDSRSACLLP